MYGFANAGFVVLQDLWLPNRAGGPSGAQEGSTSADEEEEIFWRRHCGSVTCRGRLLQVS